MTELKGNNGEGCMFQRLQTYHPIELLACFESSFGFRFWFQMVLMQKTQIKSRVKRSDICLTPFIFEIPRKIGAKIILHVVIQILFNLFYIQSSNNFQNFFTRNSWFYFINQFAFSIKTKFLLLRTLLLLQVFIQIYTILVLDLINSSPE